MPTTKEKDIKSMVESIDLETVKETYADVKDEVADFIKKNPLAAVAIAAGLGFLLGRLLSGRRD